MPFASLVGQIREAKMALEEAIAAADRLQLDGTRIELTKALGDVNGVLWAIEMKEEYGGSPNQPQIDQEYIDQVRDDWKPRDAECDFCRGTGRVNVAPK